MREILFRGKRTDNGEWIVGHLLWYEDGRARITPRHTEILANIEFKEIIQHIAYEVIPETVGQYTGVTDRCGEKIFEGDIIKGYGATGKISFEKEIVGWDDLFSQWKANKECVYGSKVCATYEIIGNVHDNHKLLKGGMQE